MRAIAIVLGLAVSLLSLGCNHACNDVVQEIPWSGNQAILGSARADGTIVVAFHSAGPEGDAFVLQRFLPDKSLDTTFGVRGGVVLSDVPTQLVSTADGGLLVVRVSSVGTTAVQKLDATGHAASGFGVAGEVVLHASFLLAGVSTYELADHMVRRPSAIAVSTAGKILAPVSDDANNYFVEQLDANGAVDLSFATSGKVALPLAKGAAPPRDIASLPNGGFVVVMGDGTASWFSATGATVASGVPAYAGSGYAGLLVLSTSECLLASNSGTEAVLQKFSATGALDSTFQTMRITDVWSTAFVAPNDTIVTNPGTLDDNDIQTSIHAAFAVEGGSKVLLGATCHVVSKAACSGGVEGTGPCTALFDIVPP